MPYFGAKSTRGRNGRVARWIARILPLRAGYCEPCAGMLGVLVARPPAKLEIASDADSLVINWWRAVREYPDRLEHLVENTPSSRREFGDALSIIRAHVASGNDPAEPDIRLAWAFQAVVRYSLMHGVHGNPYYGIRRVPSGNNRGIPEVKRLADRLRYVQLETRDASATLEALADRPEYSIYVDPPYSAADTKAYGYDLQDRTRFAELLQAQQGAVAVSGYGTEWDSLSWERTEFPAKYVDAKGDTTDRREVVWCNFAPPGGSLFPR